MFKDLRVITMFYLCGFSSYYEEVNKQFCMQNPSELDYFSALVGVWICQPRHAM